MNKYLEKIAEAADDNSSAKGKLLRGAGAVAGAVGLGLLGRRVGARAGQRLAQKAQLVTERNLRHKVGLQGLRRNASTTKAEVEHLRNLKNSVYGGKSPSDAFSKMEHGSRFEHISAQSKLNNARKTIAHDSIAAGNKVFRKAVNIGSAAGAGVGAAAGGLATKKND